LSALPQSLISTGVKAAGSFEFSNDEQRTAAVRVFALSDFAETAARRQSEWFIAALDAHGFEQPFSGEDVRKALLQVSGPESEAGADDMGSLQRQLRLMRQRFQLWLVWRHCLGVATLEETTASCSALADTLIDVALERLYERLCRDRGVPRGAESGRPQRMTVIALGKLGAAELNLSSDVDLMFCYPERGEVHSADGNTGELNQQFFVRLGQQLIQALDPVTGDGFVFRVDMRLRPYGGSGPLALDSSGIEDYYATQGRDWERYALMKARPCAGDIDAGSRLLEELSPFVFRRYLDFGAIDALRDMKARLVAERQHPDDVKLGPGGIRDVEFSVQMQQMIWGGREPILRSPKLLTVVSGLEELGHLSRADARALVDGYRFLRDTEHSLQAEGDRQTQRLPDQENSRARLAACMGFDDYGAFEGVLDDHRRAIEEVFEAQLGPQPTAPSESLFLWNDPEALDRLQDCGFSDPGAAAEALAGLRTARDRNSVSADARARLDTLMPSLLEDVLDSGDPDLALSRVLPVIRAVLRRSAYLSLLSENPHARTHFVELVSMSRWLTETLVAHPAFFDALLDERLLSIVPDRQELARALEEELSACDGDFERALEVLREFKNHHVFNVALAELRGTLPLMKVSDALTFLAEAVLGEALTLAWDDNLERFPDHADERPFIIIGYGKLGGIELGPGSDLDLVFVHDLPVSANQFLHRLVRRLLHVLTAPTYNGTLYEIDTRLRPSGNAGTMMSSLEAFIDYQEKQAWVWEHQALVRARVVAGDPELGRNFEAARREILCQPRDREELADAVVKMRARIREQLPRGEDAVDLKRGSGGIVDIEFVVQYLVLAHAHDRPSLAEFTDNVRILDAVADAELLPADEAVRLKEAYLGLRAEWHRSVLDIPDTERAAQTLSRYRDDVQAAWEWVFGRKKT
jgi:glutamate-ammonia-ligase adenylyltransferase